jgi:hypothetical protein
MIAAGDFVQRRVLQSRQQRTDLVGRAERVAAALDEQHRLRDRGQVRVTALLGLARRVQRVAEEDQARDASTPCDAT